jgi:GT2 family glycosyltransferase
MNFPNVVVIILTYKQRDKTLACLSDLLSSTDMPFRILVWDNGSQDDTIASIRHNFPGVFTHYSETNLGVAGARNAAAQLAIQEFGATHVLFLDNDMLVEQSFVDALYEPFELDPAIGQTQAKIRYMHDRNLINDGGGAKIYFVFWRVLPLEFANRIGDSMIPRIPASYVEGRP